MLGALAGGLLVQASGYSAVKAFGAIVDGSFGGTYPISQTLAAAIPLATIALGTAVAFRVQLWNIGGEGQFYMGAFGATGVELIGGPAGWPAVVLLPAMLVAAFVAGAAWALVPAYLRAWHGVNEIITTLMLNYVAVLWVNYLVYGPWKDPARVATSRSARAFRTAPPSPASATASCTPGCSCPIVAAVVLAFVLARTRWGYELRDRRRKCRGGALRGHQRPRDDAHGHAGQRRHGRRRGHGPGRRHHPPAQWPAVVELRLHGHHRRLAGATAAAGRAGGSVLFGALVNGGFAVSQEGIPQALGAVLQGTILFFVLGIGDVFSRYRLRIVTYAGRVSVRPPARSTVP